MICASCSKLSEELKNGIEILVGQAVRKLRIKTVKMLKIYYKMHILFFKNKWIILR